MLIDTNLDLSSFQGCLVHLIDELIKALEHRILDRRLHRWINILLKCELDHINFRTGIALLIMLSPQGQSQIACIKLTNGAILYAHASN